MKGLYPVIWVTFLDGLRSRTIYGISVFVSLLVCANLFVTSMIMRDVGKVAADIALSTSVMAGLLIVFFLGITIIAKDFERRTVYVALSKDVRRSTYLIGRYLGMSLLFGLAFLFLLVVALLTILAVKNMYPTFFGRVSLSLVVLAHFFSWLEMMILTAVTILFSMFSSSSFVTFVLTVITYIIGNSMSEVKAMLKASTAVSGVQAPKLTMLIIDTAYYVFPNLSLFDLKTIAAYNLDISWQRLCYSTFYGLFYIFAVLMLATSIFKRSELQ